MKLTFKRNLFTCILLILLCASCFISCSKTEGKSFATLKDFEGTTVGHVQGSIFNDIINEVIDDVSYRTYITIAEETAALNKGDIDAIALDMPVAQLLVAQHPEFVIFPENVMDDQYGLVLQNNSPYTEDFTRIINKFYEDGTLDALKEKWFSGKDELMVIDWSEYELENRKNGTLRYRYDNTTAPMGYAGNNGEHAGFEVELVLKIANELDMGVEIQTAVFSSLLNFIASDMADVASNCISITEEREEMIDFPKVSHYIGGAVLVCRQSDVTTSGVADNSQELEEKGFFEGLKDSFYKTFVKENRWKLIVNGLIITLQITVFAGVFGTALGLLLCVMLRSGNKLISSIAHAWSKLIQGVPTLVVLMIIYFVVFASSSLSPVTIGVIAFAVMFAVSVAGILNTGINAVDNGQWEAASALGFTPVSTFVRIILPPAVKHMLPLYVGELVTMLKLTSIVGYISIEDLTKATDIIRNRTFEAFFPLITTAAIYFLIATILFAIFSVLERKMDPHKRPRRLPKGVIDTSAELENCDIRAAQAGNEEVIKIEHLKKAYANATPIADINATIKRGEVISIIGPSGTGKSTLIRCINRLEAPTDGSITVLGLNVCDKKLNLNEVRRKLGMVFQSFNLFGHLNVVENVMLAPTVINKQSKQEAYNNAIRLLRSVGMAEKALNYPDELSGGQKQRVAIARCLAMEPDIILLDEPTSALDPTMVGEVQSVIKQLSEQNYTMLIVSHEMQFVKDVSTRIFYLDGGIIYEDGTPTQIFDEPKKEKTRAFVKRLRSFEYEISSKDFDLYDLNSKIESFAKKYFMTQKQLQSLQLVFEEIIMNYLIKHTEDIRLSLSYFEADGKLEIGAVYGGEKYDLFDTESDKLSMMVINKFVSKKEHSFDSVNKLTLELNIIA